MLKKKGLRFVERIPEAVSARHFLATLIMVATELLGQSG